MKLDVGYSAVIYAIYLSGVTKEAEEVEFDDIEEVFDEYFDMLDIEFECIWKSSVYITEEYRDDLRKLIEKDIITMDIVKDMLELDSQSAMNKLDKIKEKYER